MKKILIVLSVFVIVACGDSKPKYKSYTPVDKYNMLVKVAEEKDEKLKVRELARQMCSPTPKLARVNMPAQVCVTQGLCPFTTVSAACPPTLCPHRVL